MGAPQRFRVQYGQGGHEHEYCINIEGHSLESMEYVPIPDRYVDLIRATGLFPAYSILNRGTRIEIYVGETEYRTKAIVAALEAAGMAEDLTTDSWVT